MAQAETFTLATNPETARQAAEELFDAVRKELAALLPPSASVLHIGATAVPGCLTKGDLDIVVRVERADFTRVEAVFTRLFQRNHDSLRTEEFAAFEDEERSPHLGVQLTVKGGVFDFFHHFVEVLRDDCDLVRRYNDLKLAFRDKPMAEYRAAKDAFVVEVLASRAAATSRADSI